MNTTTAATAAQIAAALVHHDGNQSKAAAELGMSRSTFRRRMAEQSVTGELVDTLAGLQCPQPLPGEPGGAPQPEAVPEAQVTAEVTASVPAAAGKSMKGKNYGPAQPEKPAPAYFPEGTVTPTQFRHLLVREGLASEDLSIQEAYNWLNLKTFPVTYVTEDGAVHDQPVKVDGKPVTKAAVPAAEARDWYTARQARIAAKAAAL